MLSVGLVKMSAQFQTAKRFSGFVPSTMVSLTPGAKAPAPVAHDLDHRLGRRPAAHDQVDRFALSDATPPPTRRRSETDVPCRRTSAGRRTGRRSRPRRCRAFVVAAALFVGGRAKAFAVDAQRDVGQPDPQRASPPWRSFEIGGVVVGDGADRP